MLILSALKTKPGLMFVGTIGVLKNVRTTLIRSAIAILPGDALPCRHGTRSPAARTRAATLPSSLDSPVMEQKIEALLRKMTLDEKVGQLVQYSVGQPAGPVTGPTEYKDMIIKGEVGALFNITIARDSNAYQRFGDRELPSEDPSYFWFGRNPWVSNRVSDPLGLASTWDPELVQRAARVAAREASATGIRWLFSPMVDIARDARWGRMAEGAGEDPYLGSAMARAYVRGYQGERLSDTDSVAACVKHFVGYGAAEAGRDYNSVEISEHTLREFYLPPFHAAVKCRRGHDHDRV